MPWFKKSASPIPAALAPGDEVVAKFHGYRDNPDGPDNPWFSGTVREVDEEAGTCEVVFCDGDVSVALTADEVLLAPGRAEDYGKGSKRGSKPDGAKPVRIGPKDLRTGDEVVAKFDQYRGNSDNPWFSGLVTDIDDDEHTCEVTFCDGDVSRNLQAHEVLFAPGRDEDYGKGAKRGLKPDVVCEVRIGPGGGKKMRYVQTEQELQALVDEKGVILIFSASWCPPCKKLKKRLMEERIAKELEKFVHFAVVDVDESKALSRKYEIEAMPTIVYLQKTSLVAFDVVVGGRGNLSSTLAEFREVAPELAGVS
ncbi:unnamed protein product [Amoebophrya sp. A120]|nr:unnamed protein product [Amoebophrya sp. A120]|eukprot:GSA120T00003784001.1